MLKEKKSKGLTKRSLYLSLLCFTVYYFAYVGRYSFSSNVNRVMDFFNVGKGSAGAVGTCFFIFYGAGQVVNGLLCKKYNARYAIFIALILSSAMNFAVGITTRQNFLLLNLYWAVNGFAQSILWSSIIRLLNENLPKGSLNGAIFIMGLPVSLGTFTVYALSSLISALALSFKVVFFVASILLIVIALVWFFIVEKLKSNCKEERDAECFVFEENLQNDIDNVAKPKDKTLTLSKYFIITFLLLALFAIANNFVKDGLTTWLPTFMTERYSLDNSISTMLTFFLPCFAVFGSTCAIFLNKKFKNYILVCTLLYGIATLLFAVVLILFNIDNWFLPLICFVLVACAMSGVNNVITNIFPMTYAGKANAGTLAGVLDGFCYVGSAITAYGMGSVAENIGWNAVFYIFLVLCFLMIVLSLAYLLINKRATKPKG